MSQDPLGCENYNGVFFFLFLFLFLLLGMRVNKHKPYMEHLVGAYTVYAPGRKYFTHPPL